MFRIPTGYTPRQVLPWVFVLTGCLVTAAVPLFYFRWTMGVWLPEIMPQLSADTFYYLKQIREVMDGHPWLGNPFIREYADALFPGLLLPMWIGAIPGLLGLSINGVFVFNTFFYHVLTGAILYVLCLKLARGNAPIAAAASILCVLSRHNLLMRPVLQVAYPAFAAYLLCLYRVFEKPREPRRYVWLGATAVFAFYLYPHLWMPEFAAMGLFSLHILWLKNWKALRLVVWMWLGIGILCIPQILVIYSLFSDPSALAINLRSGLVETHRVLPLTVFNLKYVILLVAGLLLLRTRRALDHAERLLLFIGGGILAAAFSNIITGKEMDLDTHPLWIGFGLSSVVIAVFGASMLRREGLAARAITATLLAAFLFTTTARIERNAFAYLTRNDRASMESVQEFSRVFAFLESDGADESVLMTPSLLGFYVPLYTNHYLFYAQPTVLHVIPADELLERSIIQRVDMPTEEQLRDVGPFKGYGIGRVLTYGSASGQHLTLRDLLGGEPFARAFAALHRAIEADYASYLRKYHVEYVITDAAAEDNPRVPEGAAELYRDERFTIYRPPAA